MNSEAVAQLLFTQALGDAVSDHMRDLRFPPDSWLPMWAKWLIGKFWKKGNALEVLTPDVSGRFTPNSEESFNKLFF